MTTPLIKEMVEELDEKFTLTAIDGKKRKLPSHQFVLDEIKKALTKARQSGFDDAVEIVRKEMVIYPDTGKVQEDAYNYALLNAEKAIKALQNNK